jgi:hypothetical protein
VHSQVCHQDSHLVREYSIALWDGFEISLGPAQDWQERRGRYRLDDGTVAPRAGTNFS